MSSLLYHFFFFFFNDTATTEIYTLSLHDALPISLRLRGDGEGAVLARHLSHHLGRRHRVADRQRRAHVGDEREVGDRKSTRLNSSHSQISYAVFCLKKKKKIKYIICS